MTKTTKSTDEAPPIRPEDPEAIKLWIRAGGRCEFDGCNKYLLEDEFTGFAVSNNFSITNQSFTIIGLLFIIVGVIIFEISFR